jgi:uroporphyrinogen-III synthase
MTGALSGKRIVVTRAPHQAGELADRLRQHGAEPLLYPCIDIAPPEDPSAFDAALHDAARGDYDWLVLTSPNTVLILKQRLEQHSITLPATLKVAAVGPSTAGSARKLLGVEVSLVPEKYIAESLAEALRPQAGTRILLPQADIARPVLAQSLIASGAAVKAIDAYRTITGSGGKDVPALLAAKQIDVVTFTSGSTASGFMNRLLDEEGDPDDLDGVCIACIGPVAANAAREVGLKVDVMPDEHTLDGLVNGLTAFFSSAKETK